MRRFKDNLRPGIWYLVPGTRYRVPGTWYLVPGIWYQGYGIPEQSVQVFRIPNTKQSELSASALQPTKTQESHRLTEMTLINCECVGHGAAVHLQMYVWAPWLSLAMPSNTGGLFGSRGPMASNTASSPARSASSPAARSASSPSVRSTFEPCRPLPVSLAFVVRS